MFITTLEAFLEPPAMQVVFIYTKKLADIYQLVNSYNFFFSINLLNCSNPIITAPPIMKKIILKVLSDIGGCGTSNVVGPIKTAYNDPIINPKIK